jgi:outer membrane receptor protein involved in Fe transport
MRLHAAPASAFVAWMIGLPCLASGQPTPGQPVFVLEGVVEDQAGRLPGAEVRLVELERATITDAEGRFSMSAVPRGTFTLRVHLDGFSTSERQVQVPRDAFVSIRLEFGGRYAHEVTVTAAPWPVQPLETSHQVDLVAAEDARRDGVASLGDALDAIPGVASISTGDVLGTPVIRGISENRIRVLNDGIPLNHQQFSFRHSPNIDPTLADRIEIVRGPACVLYGPGAMGGVVNVVQAPLPAAPGSAPVAHGQAVLGRGTNADDWSAQAQAEGAVGRFGWRLGAVARDAGDVTTPDGALANTGYEQWSALAIAGYSGTRAEARVRWHHWSDDQGFYRPVGFRLDLRDDLLAAGLSVPTPVGTVDLLVGHQDNVRRALPAHLGGRAAEHLQLTTVTARAGLEHAPSGRLRGRMAAEYQATENVQIVPGVLLPDYRSETLAFMGYEEARLLRDERRGVDRLIASAGVRWDGQDLLVPPDPSRNLTESFAQRYAEVSGSLGFVYRLDADWSLAANLGRGWRPPNAFELFANGVHGGVAAVQIGNRDLLEESNVAVEVAIRYQGRRTRGTVTTYHNTVRDFIYLADTGLVCDLPEGQLPVFTYRQADAVIRGVEAAAELDLRPWLALRAGWSRLASENRENGAQLPQKPPDRLNLTFEAHRTRWGRFLSPVASVELVASGAGRVSGPDEPLGTPTDPYAVLHAHAGVEFTLARVLCRLDLTARNLLNVRYTDFLWTWKPWAPNPGRDIRLALRVML